MKKTGLFILLLCGMSLVNPTASAREKNVIYLATDGDDAASGSMRHPLRTFDGALKKARHIRAEKTLTEPLVIQCGEGTWFLEKPLSLTGQDSGTEQSPLVIKGKGREKTRFSGGRELKGFQTAEGGLWKMELGSLIPAGCDVPQIFVNERRAICARTPNNLEFFITGQAPEIAIDSASLWAQRVHLPESAGAALREAQIGDQLRITFLHKWDHTRRRVLSFSAKDNTLYVAGLRQPPHLHIDECSQFYLENDRSFLDEPGEYYVDTRANVLYYMPREGEDIASARLFIPMLTQLLCIEGEEKAPVQYIHFEDLSFAHSRYDMPLKGDNPWQADVQQNASITARFASHFTFHRCEVAHTGNWGMAWEEACRYNEVSECYLHDLGGGGVRLGVTKIPENEDLLLARNNKLYNNILREGGRVIPTAVGVILFQTSDNQVIHNDISDFYYTGVSVGWVWGYSHSPSKRNIINYNHIHHIGWGALSDMGGVYTLGISEGTEVSHNHIHDIYSYGYGGWGLYTDEGSTGVHMENNLVYRCKSSAFHQHYGKENVIRNNIFLNCIKAQLEATRVEPDHLPFTFSNNIIQYEEGVMYGINWKGVNFKSDENLYWNTQGEVAWNGQTLEQWQQETGKDQHSIIADPKFANIQQGDYTIGNKEAMEKIHFTPFDYREAGVEGAEEWVKLAQYDPQRDALYQSIVQRLKVLR